jgi:hypothetical protein
MLSKGQKFAAIGCVYFAVMVLVLVAYHAIVPRYLCWLFGYVVAGNLVWFGARRLYRRHLQPRIRKQC